MRSPQPTSSSLRRIFRYVETPVGTCMRNGRLVHPPASFYARIRRMRCPPPPPPPPPPAIPDWGLGEAASSWCRVPVPRRYLRLRHHEQPPPKKLGNKAHRKVPQVTTIIMWNFGSSISQQLRCLLIVDFMSDTAAAEALYKLANRNLSCGQHKVSFFDNDTYVLKRDTSYILEIPGDLNCTLLVEGFDSSLLVEEIRTMLAQHFTSDDKRVIILTSSMGSSIGKAYLKCESWYHYSEALRMDLNLEAASCEYLNVVGAGNSGQAISLLMDLLQIVFDNCTGEEHEEELNGSELGGCKLRVSECCGGRKFWSGHITPDGPFTGKKIVFDNCSGEEHEEELQAK
uniref:Uncharacterized protein n=1 Tax=Oryza punctata TaxID=4537 RepID=A0A0E0LJN1_ORYPU